jgi:hypothetical protein
MKKYKPKSLGHVWETCTETECSNKKDVYSCCATLLFGGSHFTNGEDSCLKRKKQSLAKKEGKQE